ncbi:acVLRF1 family peptidyl-tRNA hydrolase [Nocardioides sp. GY 10127]|uniref:acVLRF1 family peptidyl-tRNA hydrolase n=1 Tax=Nocardioides sp. GY 10127 TaxID=2569762 RepID=UPI0010A7942F|nr:acVLRF1 family peptidyl-tRNA hydrolase [Nocardioides sp. GY 10127]TIC86535.1 hypothetical protein E8D37_01190 [Nocardioides sp. GY 10127]
MSAAGSTVLLVPPGRVERWVENFGRRHGEPALTLDAGVLVGSAPDGAWCRLALPFGGPVGEASVAVTAEAAREAAGRPYGVLLVRRGGYAVALVRDGVLAASKTGQRHVQGRTKAGGWSQQRFARRREQQARVAGEAAAGHAARVLEGLDGPLVLGGDRAMVEEVTDDLGLGTAHPVAGLENVRVDARFLAVPDPRRDVLLAAVADAAAVEVTVHNG